MQQCASLLCMANVLKNQKDDATVGSLSSMLFSRLSSSLVKPSGTQAVGSAQRLLDEKKVSALHPYCGMKDKCCALFNNQSLETSPQSHDDPH